MERSSPQGNGKGGILMEIVLFILYAIALMLQIFLLGRAVKYPVSASWTDL